MTNAGSQHTLHPAENEVVVSKSKPFSYDQTPVDDGSIRLLQLLPGSRSDRLRCSLRSYPLNTITDQYEAISYVWGPGGSDPACTILINDEFTMGVSQTVRALPQHVRHARQSRFLWLDSICINQRDDEEKSRQVALMSSIYSNALYTIIWMGPARGNMQEGWEEFRAWAQAADVEKERCGEESGNVTRTTSTSAHESTAQRFRAVLQGAPIWAVYLNPWWTRAWCLQEVALSKKAYIWCGDFTLDWADFCRGFRYADLHGFLTANPGQPAALRQSNDEFDPVRATVAIRERRATEDAAEDLLDLWCLFKERRATLPVDKVFSLLGLVEGAEGIGLWPDYRASTVEIYRRAAVGILEGHEAFGCFGNGECISKHED